METISGNPNPTNSTYPTTKYRCEFVNLNCIYTKYAMIFALFDHFRLALDLITARRTWAT